MATLGNTSTSATVDNDATGYIQTSGPYTIGEAGTGTGHSIYIKGGTTTAATFRPVVYNDDGAGKPGTNLWTGSEVSLAGGSALAWSTDTGFASTLTNGAKYHIGLWTGSGNSPSSAVNFALLSPGGTQGHIKNTGSYSATGAAPDLTGSSPGASTQQICAYISYAPAGAGGPTNVTPPVVTGTTREGETLTTSPGTWT